jgi:hypothetical protein
MSAEIRVDGMDELRKNLRTLGGKDLGKQLGKRHKDIGLEIVRLSEKRRQKMAARYPSYRSKYVKIKASANQRQVQVTIPGAPEQGMKRHPVYGRWLDQTSFKNRVWPEPRREGWVVRPTVGDEAETIGEMYLVEVEKFARRLLEA